jgi:hypothetical protein
MSQLHFEGQNIVLGNGQSKLGISHLKEIIVFIANLAKKLDGYQADGKFSWIEKIKFGFDISGMIGFATTIDEIIKEITNLKEGDLDDLANLLNIEFGWDKDATLEFIEGIFFPAMTAIKVAVILSTAIPAFFQKLKK